MAQVLTVLCYLAQIIADDQEAQENLCLIGAIPVVMAFTSKKFPHEVRLEAAHFVYAMCSTSSLTLQFVLSCRGLKTLVELLDEDYNEQKDLVWLGVNCVCSVLELQVSGICPVENVRSVLNRLRCHHRALHRATISAACWRKRVCSIRYRRLC